MTNEKLTNKQAIGVLDGLWSNPLFGEHHRQAFEIGIKAIKVLEQEEQEPKWITVSERLPNIHNYSENYLVTLERGGVRTAMFTECDGNHWWTYDDVEAWMPLPKPYEPQESEG